MAEYNDHMLPLHEFSGTMTYETMYGLENVEFSYSLILAPDADESILEYAAKAVATFIVQETIDEGGSTLYNEN